MKDKRTFLIIAELLVFGFKVIAVIVIGIYCTTVGLLGVLTALLFILEKCSESGWIHISANYKDGLAWLFAGFLGALPLGWLGISWAVRTFLGSERLQHSSEHKNIDQ